MLYAAVGLGVGALLRNLVLLAYALVLVVAGAMSGKKVPYDAWLACPFSVV